jgi:hypothetical protein
MNFFTKKNNINSSYYFSDEFESFKKKLDSDLSKSITTRSTVKLFYGELQKFFSIPELSLHLVFTLLVKVEEMSLANFRIQLHGLFEKQIKFLGVQTDYNSENISKNDKFHFIDILLGAFEDSNILLIEKKLTDKKIKKISPVVRLHPNFKIKSLAFDVSNSNMPMVSKPLDWSFNNENSLNQGGYLFDKLENLTIFNHEKCLETSINKETIRNLNILQSTSFEVNKTLLRNLIKDFNGFLKRQGFTIQDYEDVADFLDVKNQSHTRKSYNDQCEKIQKIIETIEQGNFLSRFKEFYFPVHLDFRGRVYYSGWPLNPQGDSLSRQLLKFQNLHQTKSLCELDVSASGLQIIGLLIYDLNILQKTNFLVDKEKINESKNDIYSFHLDKYRKTYSDAPEFLSREVFKDILMCYLYNESHYGLLKKLEGLIDYSLRSTFDLNAEVFRIRKFLNQNFTAFDKVSKIINGIVDEAIKSNSIIGLGVSDNLMSYQFYGLQESKRFYYHGRFGKRQNVTIKQDCFPLTIDKRKSRRATLPNFIHSLDALLLQFVVNYAVKKSIPIVVVHDCFIVHKKYSKSIKRAYFEGAYNLFFNKGRIPILRFIDQNIVNTEFKKDYKELTKELHNSKSKIDFNIYVKSPNILC